MQADVRGEDELVGDTDPCADRDSEGAFLTGFAQGRELRLLDQEEAGVVRRGVLVRVDERLAARQ